MHRRTLSPTPTNDLVRPFDSFLADDLSAPHGIYETLYAFERSYGGCLGKSSSTHPWLQGSPLTTRLEKFDGPPLPASVMVSPEDRAYPDVAGVPLLRQSIADYHNRYYGGQNNEFGRKISPANVFICAGARAGIFSVLAFLKPTTQVRLPSAEWPAYLDLMEATHLQYATLPCHEANHFHVPNQQFFDRSSTNHGATNVFAVLSNPANPTGITRCGEELRELVAFAEEEPCSEGCQKGILLDEAYEMFHSPPVSGLQYVRDLDHSNVFVVGACTKGLQSPGIRVGWVIAAASNIEKLANFSTFAMGGVSTLAQNYAVELFEESRVAKARKAVELHYSWQRERYAKV